MNCYRERVPADKVAQIEALLGMPILVGEWHFGALDVGLPASGIGHVSDQAARGEAYRGPTRNVGRRDRGSFARVCGRALFHAL